MADRLIGACGDDRRETGMVVEALYQPVGGFGGKVMPPTFPPVERGGSPYLLEDRWLDGARVSTVVLDQVPSQANRVEESLLAALDSGRLALPVFELRSDGVRLTSLDFPHRYADAYLRDSEVDGVRFDSSPVGKSLRSATVDDVRPLYVREPYSLLFGAWDSHRKGRGLKLPRLYQSMMFGVEPIVGDRRSGRMDPVNLTGAIDDKGKAEGNWAYFAEGEKAKGTKLSEIGHGNIAPNPAHGGVTVRRIHRQAWISFAGLARLRFGAVPAETATLARAALAALALAGDRLTFGGASVYLRSGCDLTLVEETVAFEVTGGGTEPVSVSAGEAIDAFVLLRDRAAEAGLAMADDIVAVDPIPALRKALVWAQTQAAAGEQE
ncbi:type I-U CRISPR-associated RAMP protein Csb1/Cas7u [Dactylosporangium sp. NPDC000555]|uniref:type I-G CRISPR-associated RAMP protein Csb1/Cas7g n=1 Tax=Dactylosporangium sp. NPDC000555 TaxID=3154260 RepID=UPI00331E828B